MKLRYFIIASIFLFNPIFSMVDILPDFIGYFLIMRAFSNASYVYDNVYDAYRSARTMFLLTLGKFGCLFLLPFTDDTMTLVMSFTFGAVEILFGVTAFTRIFDSLSYIIARTGSDSNIQGFEKMKKSSISFLVIKLVCAFLPDLSLLTGSEIKPNYAIPISRFRPLFLGFFGIIALIFGIVWLVKFIRFFKKAATKDLQQKIDEEFKAKKEEKPGIFLAKNIIFAIFALAIGSVFVVDLNIDNVNILPDFIFSAVVLLVIAVLFKNKRITFNAITGSMLLASVGHIVFGVLSFIYSVKYSNSYSSIEAVISIPQAEEAYLKVEIFTLFEAISFFVLAICIILMFKNFSSKHITENASAFSENGAEAFLKEFDQNIQGKLMLAVISAFLSTVTAIIAVFFRPYSNGINALSAIGALAFVITFIRLLLIFNDEVYDKIKRYS
jgi:hypothetical protein